MDRWTNEWTNEWTNGPNVVQVDDFPAQRGGHRGVRIRHHQVPPGFVLYAQARGGERRLLHSQRPSIQTTFKTALTRLFYRSPPMKKRIYLGQALS